MQTRKVDVAIIGAGSAGLNARREVVSAGKSVLLIESGPYGTTCARVGCMPSKLLIAAADVAHQISGAERFGINAGKTLSVDASAVMERVRRERDRFAGFVIDSTESLPDEQRLRGHARFIEPNVLQVDEHTRVEAGAVVVAAGGTPWLPPPFEAIRKHVMVNDDVFEMTDLPRTMAVIGTGVIGLELGQALSRLGVAVTFFSIDNKLGPFTDPEVKRVVNAEFDKEFTLHMEANVWSAELHDERILLRWINTRGEQQTHVYDRVLVAAGRAANLAGLDLDKAGLELDGRGRPSWDPRTTQAGNAPVFLAGDISGHRSLLHEATDEGRIAGANAARYPGVSAHVRRTPLAIAFTDPQMAIVGTPFDQLDSGAVEIGAISWDRQGRARVMGQNRGLTRLYADRNCCRLIGAEMFGPRVEHMAHLVAWAVQQNLTVQQALEMPFYHPVIEEGLRTALRDLAAKLKVTGGCRCEDMAEAPGS